MFNKMNPAAWDALMKLPINKQHIALVWDRSPKGQELIARLLKDGPPNFRETLRRNYPVMEANKPKYIAFLGKPMFSGGTLVGAMSDEELLDQVIPMLIKKVIDQSGLCMFSVAVAPEMEGRVQARAALLQPTLGADGSILVPDELKNALKKMDEPVLESIFGGVVLPFEAVTLLPSTLEILAPNLKRIAEGWIEKGRPEMAKVVMRLHAEALPTGQLMLATATAEETLYELVVPAGQWLTTEENYRAVAAAADRHRRGEAEPPRKVHGEEQLSTARCVLAPVSGGRFVLAFPRAVVEAGDVSDALHLLRTVSATLSTLRNHAGRVMLSFEGYDADPRQVWDIPECRAFFGRLWTEWRGWMYLLEHDASELRLALNLVGHPISTGPAKDGVAPTGLEAEELVTLVSEGVDGALELLRKLGGGGDDPHVDAMLEALGKSGVLGGIPKEMVRSTRLH